jgi:hypothetical protein
VTLLGGTLGTAQLAEFGSWHKPKFTGHRHCTGGILAHVMEFACGGDHIVRRLPHGGSRELPEAYAENIIGLSR